MLTTHYSGFVNQQTYHTQLTYDEMFQDMAQEHVTAGVVDVQAFAEEMEAVVMDLETSSLPRNGMALDVVEMFLSDVDWMELAAAYLENR